METKFFLGGDISKSKVDFALVDGSLSLLNQSIVKNTKTALLKFLKQVLKEYKLSCSQVLLCCENTGVYTNPLIQACDELKVTLWVENAMKIKRAASDVRGKTDRKDAHRIAEYACRYQDKVKPYRVPSKPVQELKRQTKVRESLIRQRTDMNNQVREAQSHDKELYKALKKGYAAVLKQIELSLAKTEKIILELTEQVESIKKNLKLLTSIPGVGVQTALGFIMYTNNFEDYQSAKHLACYAGVVPFANESGTMTRPARISHLSNQRLKKLLHTAAMCAIRTNQELKAYYIRKVSQGKNKMSCLNAVRNKLVHRMFAIIQRQTPYSIEAPIR